MSPKASLSTGSESTPTSIPGTLVEVWGDTVSTIHLGRAVLIGAAISLTAFLGGTRVLAGFVASPEIARAYAMLVGIAGCLVSGVVCARLYAPKREVVETAADPFWREEVMAQLAAETGTLGSIDDLLPETKRELEELGLYELFASHDRMNVEAVPSAEEDFHRQQAESSARPTQATSARS